MVPVAARGARRPSARSATCCVGMADRPGQAIPGPPPVFSRGSRRHRCPPADCARRIGPRKAAAACPAQVPPAESAVFPGVTAECGKTRCTVHDLPAAVGGHGAGTCAMTRSGRFAHGRRRAGTRRRTLPAARTGRKRVCCRPCSDRAAPAPSSSNSAGGSGEPRPAGNEPPLKRKMAPRGCHSRRQRPIDRIRPGPSR